MDTNGLLQENDIRIEEPVQLSTDDVIPIFDIKSIHMDDVLQTNPDDRKDEGSQKELKKQSVSDLRKKVVDLNLKTPEEVKKMKKGDIIKLLETQ